MEHVSASQPTHLLTMLEFLQAEGAHTVISFVNVRNDIVILNQ